MTEPYRARAVIIDDPWAAVPPPKPRVLARTRIGRMLGGSGLDWAPPRLPDAPVKE